jgi:hypothetical protein
MPDPWGMFFRAMLSETLCSYLDDGEITGRHGWTDVYIKSVDTGNGVEVIPPYASMSTYPTKVTDLKRIRIPE